MKAVFDVKAGSGYDGDIARRYHFPARQNYLDAARNALAPSLAQPAPIRQHFPNAHHRPRLASRH